MSKKKILFVFGTRPEAIKMAPLIKKIKEIDKFKVVVCVTGQHREMLDQVLEVFDINPDFDLSIMKENQDLFDITADIILKMRRVLETVSPDLLLVHGDTTTAYAAAIAAFYKKILIGHVEAGLRTNNISSPFPEEFNRHSISIVADLHFAPTKKAYDNLIKENVDASKIYITGNTAIDALKTTIHKDYLDDNLKWALNSKLLLVTAHRRENIGAPMRNMFRAMKNVVLENPYVKVIYPVHMNPKVRKIAAEELGGFDRIRLIEPLDVLAFHNYMAHAYLILTDSGGIQEEAPSLGKPVLVMRDTTERPEGVEAGTLRIVGTEEKTIYNNIKLLLDNEDEYKMMSVAKNPYGDGHASEYINKLIEEFFENMQETSVYNEFE